MTISTTTVLSDPALARTDEARLWADPMLGGVEMTSCRFVNHRFAIHTHDTLMIGLIERGVKTFHRDGRQHKVGVGGISVVNPGEAHTGSSANGDELRYRALYVSPHALSGQCAIEVRAATLGDESLFRALWAASDSIMHPTNALNREERLLDALALLSHRYASPVRALTMPSQRLIQAREMLLDNFADNMPIERVARTVGLSPFHLMRTFRRQFGLPMHAFQLGARVERAKEMLRAGSDAMADVALACGFADQSHFTRRFKSHVGLSPAAYRRAVRK